ncbi:MAG: molybdenum cofactor guanylyltransferase [Candidatus Eremiobacteraeota bacterium]|nr:molybdenum cofactor guanylyltransferase [Candidatus Eremiobacteraeota bacterium]
MACVILAGGKGSRLIAEKGLLAVDRTTLIERIHSRLSALFSWFLLVVSDEKPYLHLPFQLVKDHYPDHGPLGGIYSGLRAAAVPSFVCACDMPFISKDIVEALMARAHGNDVVIPLVKGYYEPLHAIYRPSCLEAMKSCLEGRDLRVVSFFERVKVLPLGEELRLMDREDLSFFNINTPEDYEKACLIARGLHGGSLAALGRNN